MNHKKLPYGNCNFTDIIESGYAYVDKTRYIARNGGINSRIEKSFFLGELEREEYLVSQLFYTGLLTCDGTQSGWGQLKIPNQSIRMLYEKCLA